MTRFRLSTIVNHVVKHGSLDQVFGALSDPTRRAVVDRLAHRDATVSELAAPFAMSLPAVSKHLRVLEDAGLILRERNGRAYVCRLRPARMRTATSWLARHRAFWTTQFDSLARYLQKHPDAEH